LRAEKIKRKVAPYCSIFLFPRADEIFFPYMEPIQWFSGDSLLFLGM
jgi:hypothetical protein